MPTSNKINTSNWQITRDSSSDATGEGPNGSVVLSPKYEYLGAGYIPKGDEIIVVFASNIPPGGHQDDEDDGRIGHGVAFINPNAGASISADNSALIAVRFGEHHNEVAEQYQKPTGAFKNFSLASVTDENSRVANFNLGDYIRQVSNEGGTVAYGESQRVDENYLGSLGNSVKNEIEGGDLIQDSGYRKLTAQELSEATAKFLEQGIASQYVEGFAISKSLIPLGESTISLWAECGNDHIALDLINIGNPDIEVVKRVNGLDAKTAETAAVIEDGQKAAYTFEVTNTGDVDLAGDSISVDDPGTPLVRLPFTDRGNDNILSPNETWSYGAAPKNPVSKTRRLLDFDLDANGARINAGDFIEDQYKDWGVTISGIGNTSSANRTMAFDSENPTGEDEDLRTTDQGRVLIISEDNDRSDPDDDGSGGEFSFKWDHPVFVDRLGLLDLSEDLVVSAYKDGVLVGSTNIAGKGSRTQQTEVLDFSGPIDELKLSTDDSFAITSLGFNTLVENVVDVTVTHPDGLFTISQSDSALYLNDAADTLKLQPIRDLNGDKATDLLWRNLNNGMNVVWSIDDFTPVNNTIHSTIADNNWEISTYNDLDGDGNTDLLLRNKVAGFNVIRRLDAEGTPLNDIQLPAIPDRDWDFIDTADFDQDGNVDILLRHQAAGVNLVWKMDGSGGVANAISLDPIEDTNWKIAASADFDHDGNTDLLLRHQTAGINLIRRLDGFEILEDIRLPDLVGSNMHIEGARDFDSDGSPDIVWRDRVTGANSFWQLDGTQVVREVQLTSVDSSWQLVV